MIGHRCPVPDSSKCDSEVHSCIIMLSLKITRNISLLLQSNIWVNFQVSRKNLFGITSTVHLSSCLFSIQNGCSLGWPYVHILGHCYLADSNVRKNKKKGWWWKHLFVCNLQNSVSKALSGSISMIIWVSLVCLQVNLVWSKIHLPNANFRAWLVSSKVNLLIMPGIASICNWT